MRKILLVLMMVIISVSTATYALSMDVITPFVGQAQPAGNFYFPITEDIDLLIGISSIIPGTKTKEADLDMLVGASIPLPVIGQTDIALVFNKAVNLGGGEWGTLSTEGTILGSKIYIRGMTIQKNWMFPLTDQISIGLRSELCFIAFDGTKVVNLFQYITPVMGVSIQLLDI
ncbi:hypothetical protein ACFL96_01615 [Thermoproteota archaeon]